MWNREREYYTVRVSSICYYPLSVQRYDVCIYLIKVIFRRKKKKKRSVRYFFLLSSFPGERIPVIFYYYFFVENIENFLLLSAKKSQTNIAPDFQKNHDFYYYIFNCTHTFRMRGVIDSERLYVLLFSKNAFLRFALQIITPCNVFRCRWSILEPPRNFCRDRHPGLGDPTSGPPPCHRQPQYCVILTRPSRRISIGLARC